MPGKIVTFLICACLALTSLAAEAKYADLAGSWYTEDPAVLKKEIDGYLSDAAFNKIDGRVIAVISPHAGLAYSGPIAAYSFKALQESPPETVIVVGFTHRKYFPGSISVFTEKTFTTPLGKAVNNLEVTGKLLAFDSAIKDIPQAFKEENSVEMEIPFVQAALPGARVVLVAISDQSMNTSRVLAGALYEVMKDNGSIAVVASTDMCHYLP